MNFQPPDLPPFEVLFDSSEANPVLPQNLLGFVGNIGFPAAPPDRPWVFSNFVQSLDGLVSFGGDKPGGEWISQSRHDRWMMDLLRAHADALICGSNSLRLETQYGKIPGGPVFRIVDAELLRLRHEILGRKKLKNIVVTGAGDLAVRDYRLFRSEHVDALIVTSPNGALRLRDTAGVPVLATGVDGNVDFGALLRQLRSEYGIEYLLCEGGPHLYGSMARQNLIDEKFITISPQETGAEPPRKQNVPATPPTRPTGFLGPGLTIESARWYRWISCRRAGDHEFNRYRFSPRQS